MGMADKEGQGEGQTLWSVLVQTGYLLSGNYTEGQVSCLSKPASCLCLEVCEEGLGGRGYPIYLPGHGLL